ncbi:MAG: sensor domain-containing diguanylate cyclase [Gammaproteobacteria bacterium]|nr:sensor domain-containing diguanylate cyclase [Gammaproteobacteria bacterium]
MKTKNRKMHGHFFFRKYIGLSVILFLIPSVLFYIKYIIDIDNLNQLENTRTKARLKLIRNSADFHINEFISDVKIFAKNESLNRYIHSRKPQIDKVHVAKEFVAVSKEKAIYDQIRYINQKGMEIVRVDYNNGNPAIIPPFQLQNKLSRYYFKNTVQQAPGLVYISPLDLNTVKGKIEVPFKPMIRIGTNVYEGDNKKGILVVNYYGNKILSHIESLFSLSNSESMMVNKDGYWLLNQEEDNLWGFMFNNNITLAKMLPELWSEVGSADSGEVRIGDDLYLFNTIYIKSKNTNPQQADNYWKIITKIEPLRLFSPDTPGLNQFLIYQFLLLSGALIISWWILYFYSQKAYIKTITAINHTIFNKITSGIFITNKDNIIISANPATTKLTGYEEEEIIGKNPSIFASGYHDANFYKDMWQKLNREKVWTGEVWNKNKSGEIFPELLSISIVEDEKKQIQHYIAIITDITKQKNKEAVLTNKAHYDQLTKLPNRHYFKECLYHALANEDGSFALLFIDLDKFKEVNDTRGHDAGDELLIEVARRFLLCVRESDIVARLGGDEFTVLLKGIKSKTDAELIAMKILKQMQLEFVIGGQKNRISASIGITLYPEDARESKQLLKNADLAMYHAKKSGRDAYRFYK